MMWLLLMLVLPSAHVKMRIAWKRQVTHQDVVLDKILNSKDNT